MDDHGTAKGTGADVSEETGLGKSFGDLGTVVHEDGQADKKGSIDRSCCRRMRAKLVEEITFLVLAAGLAA